MNQEVPQVISIVPIISNGSISLKKQVELLHAERVLCLITFGFRLVLQVVLEITKNLNGRMI